MDAGSGTVLWEKNAHEVLEPASVTKIMTMLLVCEAVGRRIAHAGHHGDHLRPCRRDGRKPRFIWRKGSR